MKRINVFLLMTAFAVSAFAKVNFNGEWRFNESKSKLDQMGAAFIQTKMVITQGDNDLTISNTMPSFDGSEMVTEQKLTLDGQECRSEIWNSQRVSKANWSESGDALVITSAITFERDGQSSVINITEEWRLAEDGKALVIKHNSSSEWGERNLTLVFDRAESK
ncbi:MAG: hypothetical protein ONB24_12335 [candidate division KSB1 bacterium]|nr:hypothetical protein [candidate division KSB1 bacterium]